MPGAFRGTDGSNPVPSSEESYKTSVPELPTGPANRSAQWLGDFGRLRRHDAVGCREMRNHGDVGVAADLVDEIARRVLPPVDLAAAQRGRRRKRIQGQPLDAIEMSHLRAGGEPDRAAGPRLIPGKSLEDGASAADMLVLEEAIGAAADDLGNRLERRLCRQTLRHDSRYVAARPCEGLGQMRE